MHVTKKLALGVGSAALSLALIGGVAVAAVTPVDAQAQDEKGKPPVAKIEEILGKLVLENKLTIEQKDAIIARLKEAAEKVEAKRPAHEAKPQPKRDEKKRDPKQDEKKHEQRKEEQKTRIDVHRLLAGAQRAAAEHLGLSERALGEQLRAGKSLAEIAGTDASTATTRESLIGAITTAATAKLAELRAAGRLTDAQATAAAAQLRQAAEKIVDAKQPKKATAPGQGKRP